MLASNPASISRVRSGPRFGLPSCPGVNAASPPSAAIGFHVRVASKAPGALPASPTAPRNLNVSMMDVGQKDSSDSTYEKLTFGYCWRPKLLPNALLPSTRSPAVTNSLSRNPITSCAKTPALMTRCMLTSVICRSEPLMSVGVPGPAKLSVCRSVLLTRLSNSCPPMEVAVLTFLPTTYLYVLA